MALPDNRTQLRRPRLRVFANGAVVSGAMQARIASNNHSACDRFDVSVVLDAAGSTAAALGSVPDILMDVQVSLDAGASWTSLIQGRVDSVSLDPIARVARVRGRDLAASLVQARTQETFANQTSSQIATVLAARHGLSADVMATTTPVGRYWQAQHDRITLNQFGTATTEWDLLTNLARQEGFDVWVTGTTLHFRPNQPNLTQPAPLRARTTTGGPPTVTGLHLDRALTLADDIEVVVKSWNARQQFAFIQTARSKISTGSRTKQTQRYVFVEPNLTQQEALAMAQCRLAELSRHERVVTANMPGELTLAPRMQVFIDGTGTQFDQVYWIDEIERVLHVERGFSQRVIARNTTVSSAASSPADIGGVTWSSS